MTDEDDNSVTITLPREKELARTPQTDNLKAGEETALRVVLVNAGMAEADVRVSCMLPEGISLVTAPKPQQDTEAKESGDNAEAEEEAPKAVAPEQDDGGADAEAVLAEGAEQLVDEPEIRQENGRIVFDLHMAAAGEEAYTRVVTLRVRADEPQENIKERLLGTTLAWQIDAGETQLGEAACVRVYRPMVLGLTKARSGLSLLSANKVSRQWRVSSGEGRWSISMTNSPERNNRRSSLR